AILFRDGLANNVRRGVCGTKDIDHVDGCGKILQRSVDGLPKDLLSRHRGVDGGSSVSLCEQIHHREVRRTHVVATRANHGDGARRPQDVFNEGVWISGHHAGHLGSRFSTNAPISSSASAPSMFSVMTRLA